MADDVRKGQWRGWLPRETFRERFLGRFVDPIFAAENDALARLEALAWEAYRGSHKWPLRQPAGEGFADPTQPLGVEWLATRARLQEAERAYADPASRGRVLVIVGAARSDGTCPGEVSKSFRLARLVESELRADAAADADAALDVDVLDLADLVSEPGRQIYPCKGCVSTAMPLCHWPCSCYPNHGLGQSVDAMADIYERWTRAHAIVIVTPVHWYQLPSVLKLMVDRLVCADGGNPDPTTTNGKDPARAKALERDGWSFPKHLAGRAYGLIAHGDAEGATEVRRMLGDWLDTMGLLDAGAQARLDRYIGYYEPYANSHGALDADDALHEEVRNVARAIARAVPRVRDGSLARPDAGLRPPRQK